MSNTLGGVLDLRLRPGNNSTYEHSIKLSTMGLDLTTEGPLGKPGGGSYIISYRYGINKIFSDLGFVIFEGNQADFHDLCFKVNIPMKKAGTLSLWGLGSQDHTYMDWDSYDNEWQSLYDQMDYNGVLNTYMGGLSYNLRTATGWRVDAHAVASMRNSTVKDQYMIYATDGTVLTNANRHTLTFAEATPFAQLDNHSSWLITAVKAQKQISNLLVKSGISWRHISYNQTLERATSIYTGLLLPLAEADHTMEQVDAYASGHLHLNQWKFNAGLHLSGWSLSSDWSLQPRLSMQWTPSDRHSVGLAYGLTTRIESYDTYFASPMNLNLDPLRSHQVVLDYHFMLSEQHTLYAETWYEYMTDVPVSPTGTYCSLNRWLFYTDQPLVNQGRGRGYGIAMGYEHYLTHGFYGLVNAALYHTEYRAVDGIWRPTRYDRGWNLNVVGGKEWKVFKKDLLSVGITATAMGGLRYTPFDNEASAAAYAEGSPYVVYEESHANQEHYNPVFDLSFCISYRHHGRRADHVASVDFLNILATKEASYDYFNYRTHQAVIIGSCYSLPNLSYSIYF